jgi:hypothetical protein
MSRNSRTLRLALLASAFATTAWAHSEFSAQSRKTEELGRVQFKTSCNAEAQQKFERGVALVHSFYFPETAKAFTEAAAADPQCAIAYWGIAISQRTNPLVLPLPAAALKNGLEAVEKG